MEGLAEACEALADAGKEVYVAALNSGFHRNGFKSFEPVYAKAEEIIRLFAVCGYCKEPAYFTYHKGHPYPFLIEGDKVHQP